MHVVKVNVASEVSWRSREVVEEEEEEEDGGKWRVRACPVCIVEGAGCDIV